LNNKNQNASKKMSKKLPKFKSNAFLAPMAGVTDVAFRTLCRKMGCGLAVTEMISANALSRMNKTTMQMIDTQKEETPRCIQLFGQNVETLVKSAKYCEDKCEIIDLNFGCPASKIIKQGAGSALMERPAKVLEIVKAVSKSVNIPVSCKIRSGISTRKINCIEIAKACEEGGAQMIIVHPRTQKQGYSGRSNWELIKKVKDEVNSDIVVVGNGDVATLSDYELMKKETNCDHVMIGRGAMGNPFIFSKIKLKKGFEVSSKLKYDAFTKYVTLANKFGIGINSIKLHAQSFTKGEKKSGRVRLAISKSQKIEKIEKLMEEFFDE
jgi:tRNA-dihydrouridine synthase B